MLFHFCAFKTQDFYAFQGKTNISKRQLGSLFESLLEFLKAIDQTSKYLNVSFTKFNVEIGFANSKDNCPNQNFEKAFEHPSWGLRLSFQYENKMVRVSSNKTFSCSIISSTLQNLLFLMIAKFTTSIRTDSILHCGQVWKNRAQLRCAAHSTLICGLTKVFSTLMGTCLIRMKNFAKLCAHKNTIHSLRKSDC